MKVKSMPHGAVVASHAAQFLRVAVISHVRLVRETLAEIIERDPLLSVATSNADLSEAVAMTPALEVDVILVDAADPDGTAEVRRTLKIAPGMRIIAFPVRETEEALVPWAEAGAIGYIPTTVSAADLPRLVRDIHNGEQVCPSRIASVLFRQLALASVPRTRRKPPVRRPGLTKHERQAAFPRASNPKMLTSAMIRKPSEALAAHRVELRELASQYGLLHPRIFGSVLTGIDGEQRDLDLLVDPAENTSFLTLAAFKREAETLLGVPVSVLTPSALPLGFRAEVLQKAQPL